jgi:Arc/MetJ-type ribon-helix-helix transcriptional regulator
MAKTISVKIPTPLAARLSAAVRRRKTSRSAIVREALEGHLRSDTLAQAGSLLDLAGDLVGSVVGPSDLSSNKRRLRGYGR